ncbi:MAG TPA: serine/threonine-protein kinase [Kofleriaceae bacterium]|nr:serine/threonine-protein kinase [Kofleriaceae bacterium]
MTDPIDTLGTTHGDTPELADTISAGPRSAAGSRARIGRYAIVRKLGEGGMGVVWEATDPELGRRVAIKVLHEARTASVPLADRLRREAQALARLSHPNVIAVHDVGVDGGELYIVMQLVDGTTLDDAIAERSPAEIIALYAAAARGLEAAHAAGIVHRDFKPNNVLVGHDGSVRVTDFGLARASEAEAAPAPAAPGGLDASMTRGELVGTPGYMSPEQFRGGPVTAATDQFSFCIALWEALCGERPFPGHDVAAIREAVLAGRRRELPTRARVPRRVRAALVRGLARDPAARFRSMTELLDVLAPPRRAAWIAAIGAVALVGAVALFGIARPRAGDPCATAPVPADLAWNPVRAGELRANLIASRAPDAAAIADAVVRALDDRTARWRATRLDACQATRVRHDQTDDLLDRRNACLDRSLADERAAIDVLAGALTPELVARARDVAASGRDPDDCGRDRAAALPAGHREPGDPLYEAVAHRVAQTSAGRYRDVVAAAPALSARVEAAHDPELASRWYWALGRAQDQLGDAAGAKRSLRQSAEAATVASDDLAAEHAWAELAREAAIAGEMKGVDDLLAAARAAATRSADPRATLDLEVTTGQVDIERGDYAGALATCGKALAAARALPRESELADDALGCQFDAKMQDGDFATAVALGRQALAYSIGARGPDHPLTIAMIAHLAAALDAGGDAAGAAPMWDRALAADEAIFGKTSVAVMDLERDRALAESPGGVKSTPAALAAIERANAIAQTLPPGDPQRAAMLETLAYVEIASNDVPAANAAYERAIAAYEQLDDPLGLARVLYNAADTLRAHGGCAHALPLFMRAAKVSADTGQETRIAAAALGATGACLDESHHYDDAALALERSIQMLDALGDPLFGAQNRWELADNLIKHGQRAKGLAMAHAAADQLAGKPSPASDLRAQILAWIDKQ